MSRSSPPPVVHEYRLLRQIGSGGMGEVYKAHDMLLDRRVAVKFVHSQQTAPGARWRLLVEARAAARIQHPNVVSVYRVGEIGDRLFIVTELVGGKGLDRVPKPLPWQRVRKIAIGIARGLAAAHRQGVLHRDIKPGNVILVSDDEVKLLDFGLAEIEEAAARGRAAEDASSASATGDTAGPSLEPTVPVSPAQQAASGDASGADNTAAAVNGVDAGNGNGAGSAWAPSHDLLGQESDDARRPTDSLEYLAQHTPHVDEHLDGTVWGTPRYMAPELWRGEAATRRTDIYALGVLLYELCTGAPPHAEADIAVLPVVASETPAPRLTRVVPDIDPRFAALVARCLAIDPAARFESADALCDELERLTRPVTETGVPEGNPYRGLLTFEAEHRALFFGRRSEIAVLVERLRSEPFVVITGDSGVGKSSLCRAGLLPLVDDGALGGPARIWDMVQIMPGPRPVTALAEALAPVLAGNAGAIADAMRAEPLVFDHFVRRHLGPGRGLLLFVDQLEELVTMAAPAEAALVGKALGSLAARSTDLRLLATARSDFLPRLVGLMDEIARALYFLQPLSPAHIREAIVGPARVKGVSFESDALVDDLVASTARAEGGLPLLQFTLAELWDARPADGAVLTAAALADIGGVGGSLSRHADHVLLGLTVAQRDAARRLLTALVTAEGTRARRHESELGVEESDARAALDALIRGRLIVAHAGEQDAVYELAHDTLVVGWSTLRGWIDEEAEGREIKQRLAASAAEWERLGRTREALWGARQLGEARRIRAETIAGRDRAFLDASRRALARARHLRRAALVAVMVGLAVVYGGARLAASRAVEERVRAQMLSAGEIHAAAREKRAELDRLRADSLAAFDGRDQERGNELWERALATANELDALFQEASRVLEGAALLGGQGHDVHRMLGTVLYERALAAEAAGKQALRDELVQRMEMYDPDGVHAREWRTPGRIAITSTPAGARVTLARYQEAAGGTRVLVEPRALLGVTPLAGIELPAGSYLLELSAPDRADVRYPFVLARGERLDIEVPLLAPADIPDGFVYVPPGRFLFGSGDSEEMRQMFLHTVPIHPVTTGAYFIARHETTYGDWIEYLRALPATERRISAPSGALMGSVELIELPAGVWQLTLQPMSHTFVVREGQELIYPGRDRNAAQDWRKLPVGGIAFPEAEAYAAWLDATGRVPGARLCTDHEWERAARGADARRYPHGDELPPSDANIDLTYEDASSRGPDAVGSFPVSRSPFGVDDMSGNVFEWTRSTLQANEVLAQGGAYFFDSIQARSDNRGVLAPDTRGAVIGVRLCASVRPAAASSQEKSR